MKDFLGYEIGVGDVVIFQAPNYRHFVRGTILKLTPLALDFHISTIGITENLVYSVICCNAVIKLFWNDNEWD